MKPAYLLALFILSISSSCFAQCEETFRFNREEEHLPGRVCYLDLILWKWGPQQSDSNTIRNLRDFAEFLNTHPDYRLDLEVHTDSRGSEKANQVLSQKRSEAILHFLVDKHNISPEQVVPKGLGESQLLIPDSIINQYRCPHIAEPLHKVNRRYLVRIISTGK